jgi:signal transduction histidine kinase
MSHPRACGYLPCYASAGLPSITCGTGIDTGSIDQVFAAFDTTESRGLGMERSISRPIVDNHSGRLWAKANDGPGASF